MAKQATAKNAWGHRVGSQAAQIDQAVMAILATGAKQVHIPTIAKATGLSGTRISLHLAHLRNKKGIWHIVVRG